MSIALRQQTKYLKLLIKEQPKEARYSCIVEIHKNSNTNTDPLIMSVSVFFLGGPKIKFFSHIFATFQRYLINKDIAKGKENPGRPELLMKRFQMKGGNKHDDLTFGAHWVCCVLFL